EKIGREAVPVEWRTWMQEVVLKRFEKPDEIRIFEKGKFELVRIGGMTIGRATYEPGWRWSDHVGKGLGQKECCGRSPTVSCWSPTGRIWRQRNTSEVCGYWNALTWMRCWRGRARAPKRAVFRWRCKRFSLIRRPKRTDVKAKTYHGDTEKNRVIL